VTCTICQRPIEGEAYEVIVREVRRRNVNQTEETACKNCKLRVELAIDELKATRG
jgi:hypothetical protein